MIKSFSIYRLFCVILCLVFLTCLLCLCVQADMVRDYTVTLDNPINASATGTPAILNGAVCESSSLTIVGWVKTDLVMDHYLYTLDGGRTWIKLTDAVVPRSDLKGICPDTWQTAGYHVEINISTLSDGQYDIFVRGVSVSGDEISIVALLDVSVGNVDTETLKYREINLSRLGTDGTLSLEAGATVYPGIYDLKKFSYAEIITSSRTATVTLCATDTSAPLQFHVKAAAPTENADGTFTSVVDLDAVQYAGELALSADQAIDIYAIRLYYVTPDYYTGDLKIHMTATPYDYLGGANAVSASLQSDDTVGTYTKLYPSQDTGDPYIYFNIGTYLKEMQGISVSADHYRYAVITAQTPATNSHGLFRLFLCAGTIRGPSGNSHIAFQPINDGAWHTYIVPLYEEDDWTGQIHGMRFDFIDGNALTSDYANIASVGFYPDLDSAQAAADAPLEVYHEQGKLPQDKYEEQDRAPSGRSDAITWFDDSLSACFGGENKAAYSFDQYGHLLLRATETSNDPFVSFDLRTYAAIAGTQILRAEDYKTIVLRIMADEKIVGKNFVLYYYAGGLDYAEGTRTVGANYQGGDAWEYLVFDLSDQELWTQDILGMRLDFATQISTGETICLSDMLFFADADAWQSFAYENGIITDNSGNTEAATTQPETEPPTIEIPTAGPELEYIPPDQTEPDDGTGNPPGSQGCKGAITLPFMLLLPALTLLAFKTKTKKGDRS